MHQPIFFLLTTGLLGGAVFPPSHARVSMAPSVSAETALVVPAGSRMRAHLAQPMSARATRVGDTIYLRVSSPLVVDGRAVIPAESFIEATVRRAPEQTSAGRLEIGLRFRRVISARGDLADVFTVGAAPNDDGGVTAVADLPAGDQVVTMSSTIALVVETAFTVDSRQSLASTLGRRVRVIGSPPRVECLVQATVAAPDIHIPGTPP